MKIWENNKLNLSKEEKERLYLCENPEEELILLFEYIKSRGWIKYERIQGNSDGILGNIFEDLIGINENNSRKADYDGIEIKTKNNSSSSFISLFGYCIDSFKSVNTNIREKYGVNDTDTYNRIFNSTIKYATWNSHRGGYSFKLEKEQDKLYLRIKEIINDNLIDDDKYFWAVEKIERLFNKIKKCCYVIGEIDKENKTVKYEKMFLYRDADINKFWELLMNDEIVIDFRIGAYKSGKNKGKTHDHGTGFRIKRNKISELYKTKKEIN